MKNIGLAARLAFSKKVIPLFANLAFAVTRDTSKFNRRVLGAVAARKIVAVLARLCLKRGRLTVLTAP